MNATFEEENARPKKEHEWKPVEEGPPKDEEPVLTCYSTKDGMGVPTIRAYIDGVRWTDSMSGCVVTHWMPLPELPERNEDDRD